MQEEPNNIANGVETHILSVQGIRVVDDGGKDQGTVLLVLDAEICYYHMPTHTELLAIAKDLVMAHSNLDNAYVTIERYNTSAGKTCSHFSFNCDIGKWQIRKPKARLMATE